MECNPLTISNVNNIIDFTKTKVDYFQYLPNVLKKYMTNTIMVNMYVEYYKNNNIHFYCISNIIESYIKYRIQKFKNDEIEKIFNDFAELAYCIYTNTNSEFNIKEEVLLFSALKNKSI